MEYLKVIALDLGTVKHHSSIIQSVSLGIKKCGEVEPTTKQAQIVIQWDRRKGNSAAA